MKSGKRGCNGDGIIELPVIGGDRFESYGCDGCNACCPTLIEKVAHDVPGSWGICVFPVDEVRLADRCIKLARDMAKFGMRADLHPTMPIGRVPNGTRSLAEEFYGTYLVLLDESTKNRGRLALHGPTEDGVMVGRFVDLVATDWAHRDRPLGMSSQRVVGDETIPHTPADEGGRV